MAPYYDLCSMISLSGTASMPTWEENILEDFYTSAALFYSREIDEV